MTGSNDDHTGVPPAEAFGGRHEGVGRAPRVAHHGSKPGFEPPAPEVRYIPAAPPVRREGVLGGALVLVVKAFLIVSAGVVIGAMALVAVFAALAAVANRDRVDPSLPDVDVVPRRHLPQSLEGADDAKSAERDVVGAASNGEVLVVTNGELTIEESSKPVVSQRPVAQVASSPTDVAVLPVERGVSKTVSLGLELSR